ncbi:VanZ family protein [Microbacterium caowuchunii]|uniref:VanZ family protein n=1 Tax=Microbacterium caowuchunii TaxID=2614638 RepID=A0A5N0T831_9MICO|nr:VanZ family protein [Microbacterium caowuchunii]KAA9130654.1 VanZ family protein [Microbacterium caowuchunii]
MLEFLANVVLFVPAGALALLWLGRRAGWWWAAAIGLALSGTIEGVQALMLADRVADVRDLLANTLGSVLGALIVRTVLRTGRGSASRRDRPSPG